MTGYRKFGIFLCMLAVPVVFIFPTVRAQTSQAPNITYQASQVYTVNNAIEPLTPINTGGAIPSNGYGYVTTFAGSHARGHLDGTGTNASFNSPNNIIIDAEGNLYVADKPSLLRKITPAGLVTTVAGNPIGNASIDGQGSAASFFAITGLAISAQGDIYATDFIDHLLRKVTPGGLVTTYAGSNATNANDQGSVDGTLTSARFITPYGLVFDSSGNLFVSEYDGQIIRKIDQSDQVSTFAGFAETAGLTDGKGSKARFWNPANLAIDAADNIYVADVGNSTIRKIAPNGTVTTLNTKGFTVGPGIAADATGNVYFADNITGIIRMISPAGIITTVSGNGTKGFADGDALLASFNNPSGLALDAQGNLFVADGGNFLTRKVSLIGYTINKPLPDGLTFDSATGIISGTPTTTWIATNYTITAYNAGGSSSFKVNITVAPSAAPVITYQTPQLYNTGTAITPLAPGNTGGAVPAGAYGLVNVLAGNPENSQGTTINFDTPACIATDNLGNLYVTDLFRHAIIKITPDGTTTTLSLSINDAIHNFSPWGIAVDGTGNLYVADPSHHVIWKILPSGLTTVFAGGGQGSADGNGAAAQFNMPYYVTFDNAGNLYVADSGNGSIRKITPDGNVTTFITGLGFPSAMVVDKQGNLFVIVNTPEIKKITPAGVVSTFVASSAGVSFPRSITVDDQGNFYVADSRNNLVKKITAEGAVSTITLGAGASNLPFSDPESIIINADGDLFVVDSFNNLIRTISFKRFTIDKPLPPGLSFDPATGVISGTPVSASPATNYTISAYNTGGNGAFIVNIAVKTPPSLTQTITFDALPVKTYGDADFSPGAISTNSAIPVTYTSDNLGAATVVNGKLHITGAGTTNITASQDGDDDYKPAVPVVKQLTVERAPLIIRADDKTRNLQTPNPDFTFTYTGFVYNEGPAQLSTLPKGSTIATANSAAGKYDIIVTGGDSPNYDITRLPGTLKVISSLASISIPNAFTPNGDGVNDTWNIPTLADFPQCLVSVYNRNGNLVFQSRGYAVPWAGADKYSFTNTETYYYIINPNDGSKPAKGYVAVIR